MAEKPTCEALEQRIALLENELAQRNRFEEINHTLFKISAAVSTASSLDELFRTIHLALDSIIDTTNFFIAIYDEKKDSVTFPYRVDSAQDFYPPVIEVSKSASLTAEVIRTGRPVFVTKEERLNQLSKSNLVRHGCPPSEIWMGVPLKIRDEIIGVMAIQSYHDPMCYDQTDMDVMVSVADQVAIAIERKRTESALRESEARYRQLFENAPAGIYEIDLTTGRMLSVNDSMCEYTGYAKDELLTMNALDLLTDESQKIFIERMASFAAGKPVTENIEFKARNKSGREFWMSINPKYFYKEGIPVRASVVAHDITERKKAEDAFQESEKKYRLIAENTADLITILDMNLRFVYVSPASLRLRGFTLEEAMAQTFEQILTPESLQIALSVYEKEMILEASGTADPDRTRILEFEEYKKDGSTIWVESSLSFFRDNDLKPIQILVVSRDITNRKRMEAEKAQLEAQNRQLQKAESLGRMAGAIAHHFNNQLYAVMGNLEMAMDDLPRGADISETLAEARKAAHKAAEVSRLMLTYLGQTPGKHEPIDLSVAYRQSLTLLQAASPKGIILNVDIPSSGPIINADAGQMQQILANLLTNAWESIYDNRGTIGLTVQTVSHEDIPTSKRFPIDWQPQEIDYVCLEVSDTGSGIANKDIEKIFDPFFTTKFTGRGLGLPVVMGIVKAHGGGVTVESEPGHGSTFRIFLPVSTEKFPIQNDLPAISEALLIGKAEKLPKIEGVVTLLLIEDEDSVRSMAKKMLTRLGYTVLEAKDGVEAVDIFKKHQDKICFVLSDLTMPRLNGWETLAALRKLSPAIPVILSSGYDEAQVMAGDHLELPNAFLGKPYQLKGLRETINRVLTNQK